ncbi:MAG: glycosyltransferase family 4 protein [Nanoarchaeota archaeon]|nr:glycosyltransferase family 4 protein [Nanoarchaeota archaeon]MBU1135669.1 glycosyltransferase family 4 protein [Nanoarchaeota archaeon]
MTPKVSLIASVFFPKLGGTPTQTHEIARNVIAEGIDVVVHPTNASSKFDYSKLPYKTRPIYAKQVFEERYSEYTHSTKRFPKIIYSLLSDPEIRSSNIIHCDGPTFAGMFGSILKIFLRKKLVVHLGGNIYKEAARRGGIKSFLSLITSRISFKIADRIVTDGDDLKDVLMSHGIDGKKIVTITNGIDTEMFKDKKLDKEFEDILKQKNIIVPKNKKIIVFVGLLYYENGPKDFVDVINSIKDNGVIGLMFGGGPMFNDVKKHIEKTGAPVQLVGPVPRDLVVNAYRMADVCFFPLVSIGGVSQIVPEAMSVGRAVVTTNTGSMSKVVKNKENGMITEVLDKKKMAEYITLLLNDEKLRNKIENNARKFIVDNMSWKSVAKKYLKFYCSI